MLPILSIVVPSYNISKYVDFCVPTFIDERLYGKIQVFFIDDGAIDDTKEKLSHFLKKYPSLFHFIHKENGGHGSVINYAISKCIDTKYFKVIDGDDWTQSDELLKLVDYLYVCDDDLIISNYVRVYSNQTIYLKTCHNKSRKNAIDNYDILLHTCTFKTSLFKNNSIRLRENVFYEDVEYVLFPLKFVRTFSYCDCFPYFYRLDNPNQSISSKSLVKHYNDLRLVTIDIASFLREMKNENNDNYVKCLNHASNCLGGYYYVPLNFECSNKEIKKIIIENDLQLKRICPDLRKKIKAASLFSRLFFSFNFSLIGLLRKKKNE